MSRVPRRRRGAIANDVLVSWFKPGDNAGPGMPPGEVPMRDPVRMVTVSMLARSVASKGLEPGSVGRNGVATVVEVPDGCWIEPVMDNWVSWARPLPNAVRNGLAAEHARSRKWTPLSADRALPATARHDMAEAFAMAIADGHNCLGVTQDVSWLPADVVLGADHRLKLLLPSGREIVAVIRELCGSDGAVSFSDRDARQVTPRLLRLARRHGQVADDYLRRLKSLIKRDREAVLTRMPASPRNEPCLSRLHGMEEATSWGRDVAADLARFRAGELAWSGVTSGAVLSGPPGCGKSLFGRALASTCGATLVTGSYARWIGTGVGHQGDLLRAMAATFAEARSKAPSVLLLDELDSFTDRTVASSRDRDWMVPVVNGLLSELDGLGDREGVVVVGTCNRADLLDPALLRSGRLERHLRIGLPGQEALEAILREHLDRDLEGIDLSRVALLAAGSSGADCERYVRDARRQARAAGRPVTTGDLVSVLSDGGCHCSERETVIRAVHEAGHAVSSFILRPGSFLAATLRMAGNQGGVMVTRDGTDRLVSAVEIRSTLATLMAGRAAELLVFGSVTSAAGGGGDSDLAQATRLATLSDASLGLAGNGSLAWRHVPDVAAASELLSRDRELATRVGAALEDAQEAAMGILRPRLPAVRAVADMLVERGCVDSQQVESFMDGAAGTGPGSRSKSNEVRVT